MLFDCSHANIELEWASGDRDATAEWTFSTVNNVHIHRVKRREQLEFDESDKPSGNGMAHWGTVWYGTLKGAGVTFQSGSDRDCRDAFVKSGKLSDKKDGNFRRINDNWPVFAFARDFGKVGSDVKSVVFSIGLAQNNAVQYLTRDGVVPLRSLWTQYFPTENAMVSRKSCDFAQVTTYMDRLTFSTTTTRS
jgi:hypothetical protein